MNILATCENLKKNKLKYCTGVLIHRNFNFWFLYFNVNNLKVKEIYTCYKDNTPARKDSHFFNFITIFIARTPASCKIRIK